jgi:hypothetical protein
MWEYTTSFTPCWFSWENTGAEGFLAVAGAPWRIYEGSQFIFEKDDVLP